jgi:MoaA/NifB/PqqE/SkfB family radical SAM enzyme
MTLGLTFRCQCRCVHCYARGRTPDDRQELTTEEAKQVMDQARRLGVVQVTFSGGEPLLRDDIVELVRYAHGQGFITRISTNGLLLDRDRVRRLKDAGLTLCGVSIDDADPETHDRARCLPGLFEKVVEGIGNLREFGVPCEILTYGARRNVNEGIQRIIALGRELGVLSVYVFFPIASGAWEDSFELLLTEEEKARLRKLHSITFAHIEIPTAESPCCVLARSVLYVSPYGDVTPCPFIPYVVGNVRDHALEQVWERYCDGLDIDARGDCVLNNVEAREALRQHIACAADSLIPGAESRHAEAPAGE